MELRACRRFPETIQILMEAAILIGGHRAFASARWFNALLPPTDGRCG
jgi:hypothetical protein